jgi:hypothetical protein
VASRFATASECQFANLVGNISHSICAKTCMVDRVKKRKKFVHGQVLYMWQGTPYFTLLLFTLHLLSP